MSTVQVKLSQRVVTEALAMKPDYDSNTAHLSRLIELGLDASRTLGKPQPASGHPQGGKVLPISSLEEQPYIERAHALHAESINVPPAQAISPRQAGTNPRLNGNIETLPASLKPFSDLIRDFWRTKKGSKGDRAWKLLQTGLEAIQNAYGDDVVREQLELAINGKWQSITLANYERFKPQQKPWEKEPETKHPAYRDAREIIAEQEAKWKDIPSMTGGRGVLDPDAF